MSKKKKIILTIVCLILILGMVGCIIYINSNKSNDDTSTNLNVNNDLMINDSNNGKEETNISQKVSLIAEYTEIKKMENTNYPFNDVSEDYFIIKQNDKYGVIDYNGNVIEEIKYDKIFYLIDDYYYVQENTTKILKRKGNVVSDISKYEKGKLYKDTTDKDSLYIILNEYIYNDYLNISENDNIINLGGMLRASYYKDSYNVSGIEGKTSSIIYDASTGKIITEIKGAINKTNGSSNYIVTHQLATYMRKYSYYDSDFNMINDENYYFYSSQCDGNTYASVVTDNSQKYGYFSIDKKKLILPIQYQNIYSINNDETLFVVKKDNKYALIDNNNKIVLPFDYDYMIIINNYIVAIMNNSLVIYDNKMNKIDKYSFDIEKNNKIASYGLCEPDYDYINLSRYVDDNLSKISFYSNKEIKTLLFFEDNIELYEQDVNVNFGYSIDNDERYIILSFIDNNQVNKVEIYNTRKKKLYDINTSKYNISLSNNEYPLDDVSSIYNISYDFDCKYFVISYTDKNDNRNRIYFDFNRKEIIEDALYLYCRKIDNNYFYYPIYDKNNSREKYELHNNEEKIMNFINDIEKIQEDYFLIDRSKLYKVNK